MTGPHALAILAMVLWAGCYPFIAMGLPDAPCLQGVAFLRLPVLGNAAFLPERRNGGGFA
jgi:hypothetical protein